MISILTYGQVKNDEIFARVEPEVDVTGIVRDIIETVRREGDAALLAYCKKFDGADMNSLLVTPE
ncbi:MAG: histidinol dehydrogenase [Clostridia bacterium]|nr:histidinol dehydrogenase [Clostridia bacterium]